LALTVSVKNAGRKLTNALRYADNVTWKVLQRRDTHLGKEKSKPSACIAVNLSAIKVPNLVDVGNAESVTIAFVHLFARALLVRLCKRNYY
jgi:hypothetical protein